MADRRRYLCSEKAFMSVKAEEGSEAFPQGSEHD